MPRINPRSPLCLPRRTLAACLASGDGPEFGHLPHLFSCDASSPGFGDDFCIPDFFSDRFRNPSAAGVGTDRGYPVHGHAALRVMVNDRCALVRAETLRLGPEFELREEIVNGERWKLEEHKLVPIFPFLSDQSP
ncbi:hypothetical protein Acr_01g0008390 [Actinidia rufa]|uniref:Uncharacterized protein n=1 Tax=Actinidia rufa TaxID=165716 RepID=A0A7J0E3N5_9ERIC|nr:hypothetical protein Acr_01g0008390 [Actinidia rufa]